MLAHAVLHPTHSATVPLAMEDLVSAFHGAHQILMQCDLPGLAFSRGFVDSCPRDRRFFVGSGERDKMIMIMTKEV